MVCGLYAGTLTASAKRAAEASPVSPSIEGCRDEIRVKKGPIECDIGKSPHSEAPEVVLWGDSHAMAYAQAISSVVESGKAYMLLDCAPILSVREVARNGREIKKNCVIANEYAIAQIERLSPKLVILAARWTMFQGVPYGHESRATRYLIADRSEPRTIEHSQHVLGKYLTATIERLRRTGASVLLVGQVPEIKVTVKKCLAIAQSLGLDDGKCRSIAWPEVIERQKATNRLLSQAAMMAGARVFWPAPEFCDSLRCYAVRDGEVFYDDGDHLSKEGAMRLAPAFGAAIKAATSDVTESATN